MFFRDSNYSLIKDAYDDDILTKTVWLSWLTPVPPKNITFNEITFQPTFLWLNIIFSVELYDKKCSNCSEKFHGLRGYHIISFPIDKNNLPKFVLFAKRGYGEKDGKKFHVIVG